MVLRLSFAGPSNRASSLGSPLLSWGEAKSGVVGDLCHTSLAGAVSAAVEGAIRLDPMPNDLAAAVIADRRQLVDGTLKAIEHMSLADGNHLEGQVVVIPTHVTSSHVSPPCTFIRAPSDSVGGIEDVSEVP
jgi:hypothetical protein